MSAAAILEKELLAMQDQYAWTTDLKSREDIRVRYRAVHAAWVAIK